MGEEGVPAVVVPESFQTQKGFVARCCLGRALAMEFVGDRPEMLVSMVEIEPAASPGKAVLDGIPDPGSTVGDHQHVAGLTEPTVDGLTVELAQKRFDSQAGAGIGALADDGPAPGALAAVVETEDGADIDPVISFTPAEHGDLGEQSSAKRGTIPHALAKAAGMPPSPTPNLPRSPTINPDCCLPLCFSAKS